MFTLWLRAVVEAARSIPAMVAQEMESRAPQLLGRIRPDVEAAVTNGNGPGARIWQDVSQWVEINVFGTVKRAGWLDAVRYFSSMSLRSMKAWSHWENIDKQWRAATPKQFPTTRSGSLKLRPWPGCRIPTAWRSKFLDSVRGVSEAEWSKLLTAFRT